MAGLTAFSYPVLKIYDLFDKQMHQVIFFILGQVIVDIFKDPEVFPDHIGADYLIFSSVNLKVARVLELLKG